MDRSTALAVIRRNIEVHGYHVYLVQGSTYPRFAYTIGCSDTCRAELVFAGGSFYTAVEVKLIIDEAFRALVSAATTRVDSCFVVTGLGSFSLRTVAESWAKSLLLGVRDYYGAARAAYQIVPADAHWTIDVPNLSVDRAAGTEPVWQWLGAKWPFSISAKSVASTNLDALRGARVTEAARWEEDQWEVFAGSGPDTPPEDVRVIPLATLLAFDRSLEPVAELAVGKALRREGEHGEWNEWRTK